MKVGTSPASPVTENKRLVFVQLFLFFALPSSQHILSLLILEVFFSISFYSKTSKTETILYFAVLQSDRLRLNPKIWPNMESTKTKRELRVAKKNLVQQQCLYQRYRFYIKLWYIVMQANKKKSFLPHSSYFFSTV